MDLKPSEVTSVLKSEIENFDGSMAHSNVGSVLQVGDGVARVHGLDDCMMSELIEFPNGVMGVALNLEEDNVGAVLLGSDTLIKEGDTVKTTGRVISVPTGMALVGRVVDSLGVPVDGKGPINVSESDYRSIEGRSPTVPERQPVTEPMQTGIKAIDATVPIGRGQRELIIGDRQTGKTAVCIDAIINQKVTGGGDPNNKEQVHLHLRRRWAKAVHREGGVREARRERRDGSTRSSCRRRLRRRRPCSICPATAVLRWVSGCATKAARS